MIGFLGQLKCKSLNQKKEELNRLMLSYEGIKVKASLPIDDPIPLTRSEEITSTQWHLDSRQYMYFFVDILCVFLSCVCYAFVRVCLFVSCGHLLGKG